MAEFVVVRSHKWNIVYTFFSVVCISIIWHAVSHYTAGLVSPRENQSTQHGTVSGNSPCSVLQLYLVQALITCRLADCMRIEPKTFKLSSLLSLFALLLLLCFPLYVISWEEVDQSSPLKILQLCVETPASTTYQHLLLLWYWLDIKKLSGKRMHYKSYIHFTNSFYGVTVMSFEEWFRKVILQRMIYWNWEIQHLYILYSYISFMWYQELMKGNCFKDT